MAGLKRIWIACLLAIAGAGPLPLWLHKLVCHCPHSHSSACDGDPCQPLNGAAKHGAHRMHRADACGHHHHHVAGDSSAVSPAQRKVLRVSSFGGAHDDCAACYVLSQLTVAAAMRVTPHSTSYLPAHPAPADQLPDFDLLTAYSSRAPPVI